MQYNICSQYENDLCFQSVNHKSKEKIPNAIEIVNVKDCIRECEK